MADKLDWMNKHLVVIRCVTLKDVSEHFPTQRTAYPDTVTQKINATTLDKDLHISYIGKFGYCKNYLSELGCVSFHSESIELKVFVKVDISRIVPDSCGKNLSVRGNK